MSAKKKTFADNPALQFITVAGGNQPTGSAALETTSPASPVKKEPVSQKNTHIASEKHIVSPQADSVLIPVIQAELPAATPLGPVESVPMKRNPLYIETRSKRVQLLMQPSLHQQLKLMAADCGASLNDLVHTLLDEAVAQENK